MLLLEMITHLCIILLLQRWKTLLCSAVKNPIFLTAFAKLGDNWNFHEQLFSKIEEYDCCIFGLTKKSVDIVRSGIFIKKKSVKTRLLIYLTCHRVLLHCLYICSVPTIYQESKNLLYILLCLVFTSYLWPWVEWRW